MTLSKLNFIFLPAPFGLQNTGSICYFNSLLQMLATCTSIQNITFLDNTETERVFHKFINQVKNDMVDSTVSSELIRALHADVPTFGIGQESASEAFVLLINTINNKQLSNLFINRYKYIIQCQYCNYKTNEIIDHSIVINMFHTSEVTLENMLINDTILTDYKCNNCSEKKTVKKSRLTMLPEIIVLTFNVYFQKSIHQFPEYITLDKSKLRYKLIGQIEHSGHLHGGHYWARALRNNGCYLFNDHSYQPTTLEPTPNTYIVLYHYI